MRVGAGRRHRSASSVVAIVDCPSDTRRRPCSDRRLAARRPRVFEAVRASAVIAGRRYSTPDDVKRLANATMSHRLVLTTEVTIEGTEKADVIQAALDAVDVPAVSPNAPDDTPEPTTTGASERAD